MPRKELAKGYTTGTCAQAATKAALALLFRGLDLEEQGRGKEAENRVQVELPGGSRLVLPVEDIQIEKDGEQDLPIQVSCAIRKDSGDDPDVTNGILVYSKVKRSEKPGIVLEGGPGVGRVTKPGLEQPVGSPAINRVPRQMILKEAKDACEKAGYEQGLTIQISIPEGERLAAKTFNPRLGIQGGLSVLGTSGIVEPMSEQALIDTIRLDLKVRRAGGSPYLIAAPGNYGLDFLKDTYGMDPEEVVKCSNYIGQTMDMACELGFQGLVLAGHIGKLIKVAGGIMNTHSKWADCRMELLAAAALRRHLGEEKASQILESLTTEEALGICKEEERAMLGQELADRAEEHLIRRTEGKLELGVILFSSQYGILGKSSQADRLIKKYQEWHQNRVGGFMKQKGILYGIGVGPGDPGLLTLKAYRVIQECQVAAAPGKIPEETTAYGIAAAACPFLKEKELAGVEMPMTKDPKVLAESHEAAERKLRALLDEGKDVAFLTLGDPCVYSTYFYLHTRLQEQGYEARIISGIPSFCAAAARLGITLGEKAEEIHIIPASYQIEEALKLPGTKVLMKAGRKMPQVKKILEEAEAAGAQVTGVENCGMEQERIYQRAEELPEDAGYFTLIFVREGEKQ